MKRVLVVLALFVLVFASATFAQDIDVEFTVIWGQGVNAYDVAPTCILYDSDWNFETSLPLTCQDAGY